METWKQEDIDMKAWKHKGMVAGDMETWKHGDIDMETWKHRGMEHGYQKTSRMKTLNGKRKPKRFSLIRLPSAHPANGSLFFVRLLMVEVIRLQTD